MSSMYCDRCLRDFEANNCAITHANIARFNNASILFRKVFYKTRGSKGQYCSGAALCVALQNNEEGHVSLK
jgi:hypothetical protein